MPHNKDPQTHFGYQSIPSALKTERVASVFRSVASRYDLMNDLMSMGLHRLWKRVAIAQCQIRPSDWILDLAGGTGDLSAGLAKKLDKTGKVVLADINEAMLEQGRVRLLNQGISAAVCLIQANAEYIPCANNTFDRIIMAFGLRNVTHKEQALREMARVLKPGGKMVILEFSEVTTPWLKALYDRYSFSVLPTLGKWILNDPDSYRYLAESIRMHPHQALLKSMMLDAGFEKVEYQNLHSGIVALHSGYKF